MFTLLDAAAKHGLDVDVPEQRQLPQQPNKTSTAGRCGRSGRLPSAKILPSSNGDAGSGGKTGTGRRGGRGGSTSDTASGDGGETDRDVCGGAVERKVEQNGLGAGGEKGSSGGEEAGLEGVARDVEKAVCVDNPGDAESKASVAMEVEVQGAAGGGPAETASGAAADCGETQDRSRTVGFGRWLNAASAKPGIETTRVGGVMLTFFQRSWL